MGIVERTQCHAKGTRGQEGASLIAGAERLGVISTNTLNRHVDPISEFR
jgi:hypothetical protein